MYIYVITTTFNGTLQNTWCYTDRDSAVEAYNKQKAYYPELGKVSATKEKTATYGLFSEAFDKDYIGKVLMKGYKTPNKFALRLACRSVK